LAALVTACSGGDERDPEELLLHDLEAVEAAFNDSDPQSLYRDYIAADCMEALSQEDAGENFSANVDDVSLAIEEPERVEIEGNRATVRAVMTVQAGEDSASATDSFEMVFEDGHWRFVDCFGGREQAA
jgi:hypothetical protein